MLKVGHLVLRDVNKSVGCDGAELGIEEHFMLGLPFGRKVEIIYRVLDGNFDFGQQQIRFVWQHFDLLFVYAAGVQVLVEALDHLLLAVCHLKIVHVDAVLPDFAATLVGRALVDVRPAAREAMIHEPLKILDA